MVGNAIALAPRHATAWRRGVHFGHQRPIDQPINSYFYMVNKLIFKALYACKQSILE
jgi:hypothetical protein